MWMSLSRVHLVLACAHVIRHDVILLDSHVTGLAAICKFNRSRSIAPLAQVQVWCKYLHFFFMPLVG